MRDYLLDTQTIRYWYDEECAQHAAVIGNFKSLKTRAVALGNQPRLLVSVITLGEIEFGHRVQTGNHTEKQDAFMRFVRQEIPVVLELAEDAVAAYGEIRGRLFNRFAPGEKRKPSMRPEQLIDPNNSLELQIQENDLWLCAQAVGHGMVLVTNDKMKAISEASRGMKPHLLIQNWTIVGAAK